MKLDIGGLKGQHEDFLAVNITDKGDIQHDLSKFPWPFKDNSIDRVLIDNVLEEDSMPPFRQVMAEVWRICKNRTFVYISVPNWKDDLGSNPWHNKIFKPEMFRYLNRDYAEKTLMKGEEAFWMPFNFFVRRIEYTKGRIRFWKKYNLNVVLEVIK